MGTTEQELRVDDEVRNFTYFRVRPDFRDCAFPLCGGFFVQRVNRALTRCADGSLQSECYVAELDLEALELSDRQEQAIRGTPEIHLLRGNVRQKVFRPFGNLGKFVASEAWRGHEGIEPSGAFFRAKDEGIVCVTFPCLSFSAELLNRHRPPIAVAGVDVTGITKDPSDAEQQLLEPEGLLVAAHRTIVTGPAGRAIALDANEYYLPVEPDGQLCGSRGLPECPDDSYCDFAPEADCGRTDIPGLCVERPEFCLEIFDPVCGCDGMTYSNACFAAMAGVSVDHDGECESEPEVCGTIVGIPCPKGEYCNFGEGMCQVSDAAGMCEPIPDACLDVFDPVCGCDGVTYGNACFAAMAGANIDHEGECRATE